MKAVIHHDVEGYERRVRLEASQEECPGVCIQRESCSLRSSDARLDSKSNESNYEDEKLEMQ